MSGIKPDLQIDFLADVITVRTVPTRRSVHADRVCAWNFGEVVLEHYRYAPGPAGAIAMHAHPDFQLGVSVDTPGEYAYRRARHAVPARSISILHPGEPHAARDLGPRERPGEFWTLYLAPERLQQSASTTRDVFFAQPVLTDPRLFDKIAALPGRLIHATSQLERDSHLESALHLLVAQAEHHREAADVGAPVSRHRLDRVRERLEEEQGNPSLDELARDAELSRWRFCREFRRRFGHPPHAYLLHARIRRAKCLLLAGTPLVETALRCGFTDQSHFTRHFRRFVDVTPARYQAGGKNVQDTRDADA